LFEESQQALVATRRAYDQLSRQAWTEFLGTRPGLGYALLRQSVVPVTDAWQPEMLEAVRTGEAVATTGGSDGGPDGGGTASPALTLPLKVRDDVIGALSLHRHPDEPDWTAAEMELAQRLVDQIGTALDSARLFQETQQRAAREQAIRRITEQMRSTVDIEAILQNTMAEVARTLGVPRAYVRLGTEAELLGPGSRDKGSEAVPGDDGASRQSDLSEVK
jgi:hypothetical protein